MLLIYVSNSFIVLNSWVVLEVFIWYLIVALFETSIVPSIMVVYSILLNPSSLYEPMVAVAMFLPFRVAVNLPAGALPNFISTLVPLLAFDLKFWCSAFITRVVLPYPL